MAEVGIERKNNIVSYKPEDNEGPTVVTILTCANCKHLDMRKKVQCRHPDLPKFVNGLKMGKYGASVITQEMLCPIVKADRETWSARVTLTPST